MAIGKACVEVRPWRCDYIVAIRGVCAGRLALNSVEIRKSGLQLSPALDRGSGDQR